MSKTSNQQHLIDYLISNDIPHELKSDRSYFALEIDHNYSILFMKTIMEDFGFKMLLDTFSFEGKQYYILLNLSERSFLTLIIKNHNHQKLLDQLFPNYRVQEKRKRISQSGISERETVGFHLSTINHEFCGFGEIFCTLDGQNITYSNFNLGIENKNIEENIIGKHYSEIDNLIYRFNPSAFVPFNNLYYLALEDIFQVTPSNRSISLRMIGEELTRILNHVKTIYLVLNEIGIYANAIEFKKIFFAIKNLISKSLVDNEPYRFSTIGGVHRDISLDWRVQANLLFSLIKSELNILESIIYKNHDFQEIMKRKKFSRKEAISFGLTGPGLRATGINFDLRKHQPYHFYHQVEFEIPLGHFGSSFDRLLGKSHEIKGSVSILEQLMDNISLGQLTSIDYEDIPQKDGAKDSIQFIETADGVSGLFLSLDDELRVDKFRFILPVNTNANFITQYLEDIPVGEALAHFYISNINFCELER